MMIGLSVSALYNWIFTGVVQIPSGRFALLIGGVSFVIAMAPESHDLFVSGSFWNQSLRHYDLLGAKVWALILLWNWLLRLLYTRRHQQREGSSFDHVLVCSQDCPWIVDEEERQT